MCTTTGRKHTLPAEGALLISWAAFELLLGAVQALSLQGMPAGGPVNHAAGWNMQHPLAAVFTGLFSVLAPSG